MLLTWANMDIWFMTSVSAILISLLLLSMGTILSMKQSLSMVFTSPFECGFSPSSASMPPISIHFFIVMLIFLVFDVELILLFPFLLSQLSESFVHFSVLTIILNILSLGLFYEWVTSKLEWVT